MPAPGKRPNRRIGPHFLHHAELGGRAQTREPSLTPRQRVLSLAAVITAAFGVGLTFGIGAPLTALTLEQWQQPNWLIGVAGAVPALAVLLVLPFVPGWAAKTGAVPAIMAGCLFNAAGFMAMYWFQTPLAWLFIRFVMSAGLALPWLIGETWINTASVAATRGRVIAIYAISFFMGFAAGPVILELTGITGVLPFLAGAMGPLVAGLPIVIAARFAPDMTQEEKTIGVVAAARLAPLGVAGGFLGGAVETSYFSLLANVGLAAGMEPSAALRLLALLTLGGGLLQFGIGWLADKFSRTKVLLSLCAAFIVLSLALPWALGASLFAAGVAFALGGIVLGFYTIGLAIIGDEVSPRDLASANAAFLVMYQIGGMIGPAAAGAAMTVAPVGGFVAAVSAIVLVGAFAIILIGQPTAKSP